MLTPIDAGSPRGFYATGGTVTQDGDYRVHTFYADDTLEVLRGRGSVDCLVIGGGGSGGAGRDAGGGGAGEYITTTLGSVCPGSYSIDLGEGGAAVRYTSAPGTYGNNGSSTTGLDLTARGGGGGACEVSEYVSGDGLTGGSGGGGSGNGSGNGDIGYGGSPYDTETGYAGGYGRHISGNYEGGGGGGGAGGAGGNSTAKGTGVGGAGATSSITGSSVTRAGGGGATGNIACAGGSGGGGAGAKSSGATSGSANTGSGGGAIARDGSYSGAGGSGVFIIRYYHPV